MRPSEEAPAVVVVRWTLSVSPVGATKRKERDGNGMKIDGRDDDTAVYAHGRALNLKKLSLGP